MSLATRRDVRYGPGAIRTTPQAVADLECRRVLLVCGRRSFEASGADRMLSGLTAIADVRRWSEFAPNTDAADVVDGLQIVEKVQPDVIIGVGGGSVMDMAKLLCAFGGLTELGQLQTGIRAGDPIASRGPRLILAPTTSGSGSEATHFAVVYIEDEKYSIAGPGLLPDVVILDPELAMSGSSYQRATSGIDAVTQAIESLWAVGATAQSRRHAQRALGFLLPAIERFVHDPSDESARAMAVGSHLAGRAINVSKTTAAHALSYGITKRYGVSHGHAVALTLGAFIEAHARVDTAALVPSVDLEEHRKALRAICTALGATDASQARVRFVGLGERLGLQMRLSEIGASTVGHLRDLAQSVNVERLGNNPVRLTADELAALLSAAA